MFELGNLMAPPEVATARAQSGSFGSQLFRALFPAAKPAPALARTSAPSVNIHRVRDSLAA